MSVKYCNNLLQSEELVISGIILVKSSIVTNLLSRNIDLFRTIIKV